MPPPAPDEGGSPLAELWRNLWPWDDLNAKGPPERWLKLGLEVIPVLAALVASGGPVPRLLKANLAGELLSSDNIGPSVAAVVASSAGQAVVNLPDTSPFHAGDVVNITSGLVTGSTGKSTLAQVKAVASGSITLATNLNAICAVGDVVTRVPVIDAPSRKRAWDWTSGQAAAQGVGFQIIIAGVAGIRHIVNHISCIIINTNSAAATGVTITCRDGSSVAFIMWQTFTGIAATTGDKDRVEASDLAAPASIGNAVYIQQENNIPNTTSSVSAGGYDSIAEPT